MVVVTRSLIGNETAFILIPRRLLLRWAQLNADLLLDELKDYFVLAPELVTETVDGLLAL